LKLSFETGNNSVNDPRSKILQNPEKLEDWELIAILLGKGSKGQNVELLSRKILSNFSGLFGLLNSSPSVLKNQVGLGKAKVASLLAAREMVNRLKLQSLTLYTRKPITIPDLMELLYLRAANEVRECFYLITLDHLMGVINFELIAKGSLTEVGVYPRDIVKMALDDGATFVIISHNHPKQSCKPSKADYELYEDLSFILDNIEIELIDQLVMGVEGVFSCKNRKLLFERQKASSEAA
jgi:DNA repair protein RadC